MDHRQFQLLQQMGITLWQPKPNVAAIQSTQPSVGITIESLVKKLIFTDILQAMHLTLADVQLHQNRLNLGWFNWQFNEQENISFDEQSHTLYTPELTQISQNNHLKKQLWHCIFQHLNDSN